MSKIAFFGLAQWEGEYLKPRVAKLSDTPALFSESIINETHLPEAAEYDIVSIFVNCAVDEKVLARFPKLKLLATRSTGFDHIDLAACKKRGIIVASVPSYGENTVAEFAFGLLLALSRKIIPAVEQVRTSGSFSVEGLQGFDLKGKTLGVIGTGRIGWHVIQIARGFEMHVIAYDRFPNTEAAEHPGFKYLPLDEVLAQSDVVTLHVPLDKTTHHLLSAESFSKMKRGAYLINTSRGAVVDTKALVDALGRGQIAGAGLDVLEEEGVIKDEIEFLAKDHPNEETLKEIIATHVLMDHPRVIVTPHNAFNTREALERILNTTMENIEGFLNGKPVNVVK